MQIDIDISWGMLPPSSGLVVLDGEFFWLVRLHWRWLLFVSVIPRHI
jgi:hypothetical protein